VHKVVRKFLRFCGLYDSVVDLKRYLTKTQSNYINFYSNFIDKGDLCFDIGANVGRRTKVFLKLGAKVIAVEPQEHCIKVLRKKYEKNNNVILVKKAIGEEEGHAEMMLCDSHSLSSLSKNWIESVKGSGRYSQCTWNKTEVVPIITLDSMISQYGKPSFIKIDVEGYEYEVLKGLSQPIRTICFEFTPEFIESTIKCVKYLSNIGSPQFNYCTEDKQTTFVFSKWCTPEEMGEVLSSSSNKTVGDIYAKFEDRTKNY